MVFVVSHAEMDSNTEQENVLDRKTEEKIAKEKPKNHYLVRPMFIAQRMDTGANGQNMEIVVLHAETESSTEQENARDKKTEEKPVSEKPKNQKLVRPTFTAQWMDTGANGQNMEAVVLHAETESNTEHENARDKNTEEKPVSEKPKNQNLARPMFTAQWMDTGAYGQNMEIVVLNAETESNTEQENARDKNTEEKPVLEKPKNQNLARPMFTAQRMDIGLNMENGRVAVKHAAKEFRHVAEPVMSHNMEAKLVKVLLRKPENVFSKRNVSSSQFVHARNTSWKNSPA